MRMLFLINSRTQTLGQKSWTIWHYYWHDRISSIELKIGKFGIFQLKEFLTSELVMVVGGYNSNKS